MQFLTNRHPIWLKQITFWWIEMGDILIIVPCSQGNRIWRSQEDSSHKLHKYWWHLFQAWAEASHSRTQLWHCWWCMFELRRYPNTSESHSPLSHHGRMTSLSVHHQSKKTKNKKTAPKISTKYPFWLIQLNRLIRNETMTEDTENKNAIFEVNGEKTQKGCLNEA